MPMLQATIGLMGLLLFAVAGVALWLRPRIADGRIADGMDTPYPMPESIPAVELEPEADAGPWDGVPAWIGSPDASIQPTIEASDQTKTEPQQ